MNRALGYGLALLTAASPARSRAQAHGAGSASGEGVYFMAAPAPSNAGAGSANRSLQGYLGVDVRDVSDEQIAALKLKDAHGAEIILVDHDAPAGKVGLREHDVVLQMNGRAIDGEDQIRRMLRESPPGRTVVLLVSRDGQQMTFTTQLANREDVERQAWQKHFIVPEPENVPVAINRDEDPVPAVPSSGRSPHGNSFIGAILMSPSYTGAMLEQMSPQLAQFFGAADGKGLLVRSIAANSPAADAGMQAGDVITHADSKPIASTGDWSKAVKNSHGHSLSIVVLRDKKEQTLTLTPDGKKRSSADPQPGDPGSPTVAHMGFSLRPRS
jgi:serine protease Do